MPSRACRAAAIVLLASGCLGAPGDDVGSREAAVQGVTWMNVVGADAVDDDLTKTDTGTLWNAGAASVQTLAGDGYAEFTTGESTSQKMVGLSNGDAGQHYSDIDFALYLKGNGSLDVYEAGVQVAAGVGTYAAGDLFRVQVLAGVVTYWKNSALLYTSAGVPVFPLLVDTSLRTPGATVYNVHLQDLTFWTNLVGANAVANDLSKTGPDTLWNAGASSLAALAGDGYVEFTTGERTTDKVAGLNAVDKNQGVRDIDFGVFLRANGRIAIREKGVDPVGSGFGPYQVGDVFRIDVTGGVVTYARNGAVFYTSLLAATLPLVLDTSLRTPGATILDARVVPTGECSVWTETLSQPRGRLTLDADGAWLAVSVNVSGQTYLAMYRRAATGWIREQTLVRTPSPSFQMDPVAIDGATVAVGTPYDDAFGSFDGSVRTYRHDGTAWTLESHFAGCPNTYNGEGFGVSVDVQGDLMVVGRQHPDDRAYVYRRSGSTWRREAFLEPSNAPNAHLFGRPVAIGGDRIFVSSSEGIYVFRLDLALPDPSGPPTCGAPHQGKWVEEAILGWPNPQAGDLPDIDASSTGTLLLAGNDGAGPGEAYLYSRTPDGWVLSQTLVGSGTVDGDEFGHSVVLGGLDPASPSFAVVGTPAFGPGDDSGASPSPPGAAHLFMYDGDVWSEVDRLESPGPGVPRHYGEDVAATESDVVVLEDGFFFTTATAVHVHDVSMCTP